MISLSKVVQLPQLRSLSTLCNRISQINLGAQNSTAPFRNESQRKLLHLTAIRNDLMEFFDDKKNWAENEIKVGRAWKEDELRIKSNSDLHKLWYILLKERNMLLTMEHECNEKMELFPSPERLDKVRESMENLETVVKERNNAYHLLEIGTLAERSKYYAANEFGIKTLYEASEHTIPAELNKEWFEKHRKTFGGPAVRKFIRKYREKIYMDKRKAKNRDRNQVMMLLRRNPNLDLEMLKDKYPDVDINALLRKDKCRGHYVPKVD